MIPPAAVPLAVETPLPSSRAASIGWGKIVWALLGIVFLTICAGIVADAGLRWDFRVYYAAAKAWSVGINPYNPRAMEPFFRDGTHLGYVYPPDTLWLFRPFNALDGVTASRVYLLLQIGLVGALYACWQRFFLSREDRNSPWFAAFCLFGLGGALMLDLRAGNVALVEQALLWASFVAYLRGRYGWFCVWLWLASSLKLTPLVFSGLLLVAPVRQWGKFVLVWAAMAGRLALDYFAQPNLFKSFLFGLKVMSARPTESSVNNPTMPEFLKDVLRASLGPENEGLVGNLERVLYALIAVVVIWFSWRAWLAVKTGAMRTGGVADDEHERSVLLVCLACVMYGLLVPRLKDYSSVILILPIWRLARCSVAGRVNAWMALIMATCLSDRSNWFGLNAVFTFLWSYQTLVCTFLVWVLFLRATLVPATSATGPNP